MFWIVLAFISPAFAAGEVWTLTAGDLSERSVLLRSLDATTLTLADPSGAVLPVLPLDDFLDLSRGPGAVPAPAAGTPILHLAGGARIVGHPVAMANDHLRWSHPILGELSFPLTEIRALSRVGDPVRQEGVPAQDTARLRNGDTVRGILAAMDDKSLTLATPDGARTPISWDAVASVQLVPAGSPPVQAGFRIQLADGSSLPGDSPAADGSTLVWTMGGAKVAAPLSAVVGIEHLAGPVRWLSDSTPDESIQIPYLPDATPTPARFDHDAAGLQLRFAAHPIRHAIATKAYSRLTYKIPPGFRTFRAAVAIDDSSPAPYANVTVRVLLDGKLAWELPNLTSAQAPATLAVPLGSAKTLTLEVNYGQNLDVQDHVLWLSPALLK